MCTQRSQAACRPATRRIRLNVRLLLLLAGPAPGSLASHQGGTLQSTMAKGASRPRRWRRALGRLCPFEPPPEEGKGKEDGGEKDDDDIAIEDDFDVNVDIDIDDFDMSSTSAATTSSTPTATLT